MAVAILVIGFAIRCIGLDSRALTGDELWSASLAKDGLWTGLLTALRFDVHPPLYILQLSLWMLFGDSDRWLMLNAIVWNTAAIGLLIVLAGKIYGSRVGLGAGALLAVAPGALSYADDARMYSMLLALILLAWYAQTQWLDGKLQRRGAIWLILTQCLVAYTHGAALVMLSGVVILGFATCLTHRNWRMLWRWMAAEMVVFVLVTPTILVAFMRGVRHPAVPNVWNFLETWTFLTTGQSTLQVIFVVLGLIMLAVLGTIVIRGRDTGLQTACLVFLPLILAGLVSHLFRPIWLDRTFYTIIPFMCLGLARATLDPGLAGSAGIRIRAGIFAVLLLGWAALGVPDQFTRHKGDGFRETAELVHQAQRPGDVIVSGPDYSYWYFMWYYHGRDWGKPLHAFILNADWTRMLAKLPQGLVAMFDMSEADRILPSDGATVMLWDPDKPIPVQLPGRIIAVGYGQILPITTTGYHPTDRTKIGQMVVEIWEPAKAGE